MARTIRIDDEVYAWLQQHAQPFEDTPNSVLRRLVGFDSTDDSSEGCRGGGSQGETGRMTQRQTSLVKSRKQTGVRRPVQVTGEQLNDEWKVGARHALFHRDGIWYNNLRRFPGALFNPSGYILFGTEEEYRNCQYLKIGKETNVPKGIVSIPGYVRMKG